MIIKYFWITNISNFNVSLYDLNITIPAKKTVNLLDQKHYYYTLDQLQKSASSGSLFKKRDKLVVREVGPESYKNSIQLKEDAVIPNRQRSSLITKKPKFEELNISDIEYAQENADLAEEDRISKYK